MNNHEFYPQVYRTTEAMGVDQTPTPVKGHVSTTHTDGSYYISAEGADGQQVADLIISAIRQMPANKKRTENGFLSFTVGLLFISFVTVAIVNIFFLANPPQPTTTQIKTKCPNY